MATSLQFSLRSMLVVMLMVAIISAVIAPAIRAWDTQRQLLFGAHAAVTLLLLGAGTVGLCAERRKVERKAGAILFRTVAKGSKRVRLQQGFWLAVSVAVMIAYWFVFSAAAAGRARSQQWSDLLYYTILLATWAPRTLTNFWWRVGAGVVEVAENGLILQGVMLKPWNKMESYRWASHVRNRLLIHEHQGTWPFTRHIDVGPEDRAAMEQVLRQKIAV